VLVTEAGNQVELYDRSGNLQYEIIGDFGNAFEVLVIDVNTVVISAPNNYKTFIYDLAGNLKSEIENTRWAIDFYDDKLYIDRSLDILVLELTQD